MSQNVNMRMTQEEAIMVATLLGEQEIRWFNQAERFRQMELYTLANLAMQRAQKVKALKRTLTEKTFA